MLIQQNANTQIWYDIIGMIYPMKSTVKRCMLNYYPCVSLTHFTHFRLQNNESL